jgi:hypothetical protein
MAEIDILIGAAFGSFIILFWDYIKIKRESLEKEKQMLIALRQEIKSNKTKVYSNLQILDKEVISLKKNEMLLAPLIPFRKEIWNLIILNPPRWLFRASDPKIASTLGSDFNYLGVISYNIDDANEVI